MSTSEHAGLSPEADGRFAQVWLLVTAAMSGAVVMAVELLGARMLSVVYGGSLVVWAAMISVTLLSLAAGYFLGGWIADRRPGPILLYCLLLAGALLVLVSPHARFVLRACQAAMGVRGGALASSIALFMLPLGLLGMNGPYVIRLLSKGQRTVGVTAGSVYAISTLGSVAGTLLTGLWLVPSFGVAAGFRITATVMILTVLVGLAERLRLRAAAAAPALAAALLMPSPRLGLGDVYAAPDGERVEVIGVRDSAYGQITVLAKGDYNLLVVDGVVQTGVPRALARLQRGECLAANYFQELLPYMVDDAEGQRVLVVGLAGGMTATLLREKYGMDVFSVDLDPTIIEVARAHFGFEGPAVATDGRLYLETCDQKYDCCVIDTYSGDVFPFHLSTIEAFEAARGVLKPGGVLCVNVIASPTGKAFACIVKTIAEVFTHVLAIGGEDGDDVQTITVFASCREIEFNGGWLDYTGDFTGIDPIGDAIERLTLDVDMEAGIRLTDDYNPIDFLRAEEAVRWRARTRQNVGAAAL